MLKKLQIIFIDRTNPQRSTASLKEAIAHIQRGKNVAIFPEGTRSKTGDLGVFRRGGFKLAIQSQTPIIPVAFSKSAEIWPRGYFKFNPGTVTATFGKPISVENKTENDIKELMNEVVSFIERER